MLIPYTLIMLINISSYMLIIEHSLSKHTHKSISITKIYAYISPYFLICAPYIGISEIISSCGAGRKGVYGKMLGGGTEPLPRTGGFNSRRLRVPRETRAGVVLRETRAGGAPQELDPPGRPHREEAVLGRWGSNPQPPTKTWRREVMEMRKMDVLAGFDEGSYLKKELPIFFGLSSWEQLEEALEGAYSLDINPLPKLREALRKMGLPNWQVIFLPGGTMPTPAHLPCLGVRLELDPWEDNEGNQFYNRLVSLHVFDEEWADLLLGDDGVPEV